MIRAARSTDAALPPWRARQMRGDADGQHRLSGAGAGELLASFANSRGGQLVSWRLDYLDVDPGRCTTATFAADLDWPNLSSRENWRSDNMPTHDNRPLEENQYRADDKRRTELIGVTIRASGPNESDRNAQVVTDQARWAAVWLYPDDPDLPGLARATYPSLLAALLRANGLVDYPLRGDDLELKVIGYRPRRRAVLRARLRANGRTWFVKVLHPSRIKQTLRRHQLLQASGLPVANLAAVDQDGVLVFDELPGRPLARAIFEPTAPVSAHQVLDLLDRLPSAAMALPRRDSWTDSLDYYARLLATQLPDQAGRIAALARRLRAGLRGEPTQQCPVHGDFHEGQLFVADGRITGLLDTDSIGPGRRSDDLACLLAHLSTVQGMNATQAASVQALREQWQRDFEVVTEPRFLRLRTAGVALSLATSGRRVGEAARREALAILAVAESWERCAR